MAAREDGGENLIDDFGLADDDAAELVHHLAARLTELGQILGDAVGGHRDGPRLGGMAAAIYGIVGDGRFGGTGSRRRDESMLQPSQQEMETLRSQIVTSKSAGQKGR